MRLTVRWRLIVQHAFKRWTRSQDAREVLAAASLQAWLSFAVVIPAVLALASLAPGARDFFKLPFRESLACLVPALGVGIAFALLHRGRQRLETWGWLCLLPGIATLHFFLASLMALAAMPGALVFAAGLLFTAGYHGRMHRVAPSQPFIALGTASSTWPSSPS